MHTCKNGPGRVEGDKLFKLLEKYAISQHPMRIHVTIRKNQYRFGTPGPDVSSSGLDLILEDVEDAVITPGTDLYRKKDAERIYCEV